MLGPDGKALAGSVSCVRPVPHPISKVQPLRDYGKGLDSPNPFGDARRWPEAMYLGAYRVTPEPFRVIEGLTFPIPCDRRLQFRGILAILSNRS